MIELNKKIMTSSFEEVGRPTFLLKPEHNQQP